MTDSALAALQARIRQGIPLSDAMGYRITALDRTQIVVEAPLAPNVNVHGTAFAGSIYALGTLSAWALGNHLVNEAGMDAAVVIAEAAIRYRAPIHDTIHCRCQVSPDRADAFLKALRTVGHARLELEVAIGEGPAALLHSTLHVSLGKNG